MMTFYQSTSLVKEYLWLGFNFIPCVELEIPGFQEMHIPQTTSGTITTKLREVLTWELENVDLMLKRAWKWIIKHYITKRYIIIHQKIVYRWPFCKRFELGKKIFKSFLIRQKFAFSKNRHTKKEHWWPKRRIYYWVTWRRPITEDSKETLSLCNLKRTLSMMTARSYRTLNNFCPKKTLLGFLVIIYDKWVMGIEFHVKILVLESLVFMLPVT